MELSLAKSLHKLIFPGYGNQEIARTLETASEVVNKESESNYADSLSSCLPSMDGLYFA